MSEHYILEGKTAKKVDLMTWARWFETSKDRFIANDTVNECRVSTVFLGTDHQFDAGGPPLLFETMIFGGPHDQWQERCSTYERALEQHAAAMALANGDAVIDAGLSEAHHA